MIGSVARNHPRSPNKMIGIYDPYRTMANTSLWPVRIKWLAFTIHAGSHLDSTPHTVNYMVKIIFVVTVTVFHVNVFNFLSVCFSVSLFSYSLWWRPDGRKLRIFHFPFEFPFDVIWILSSVRACLCITYIPMNLRTECLEQIKLIIFG